MRKLRLRNQTALIRYALSRGVLAPVLMLPRGFDGRRRARRARSGPSPSRRRQGAS